MAQQLKDEVLEKDPKEKKQLKRVYFANFFDAEDILFCTMANEKKLRKEVKLSNKVLPDKVHFDYVLFATFSKGDLLSLELKKLSDNTSLFKLSGDTLVKLISKPTFDYEVLKRTKKTISGEGDFKKAAGKRTIVNLYNYACSKY